MNDDRRRPDTNLHVIGQPLDTLSLHEFDARIAVLRAEIDRLEIARERKRVAFDAAGSIFGSL